MTAIDTGKGGDRSPVSLTGRYTGEVWVRNELAPRSFDTRTGQWLYRLLSPLDWLGKHTLGLSLETMLLQRHLLIDHCLNRACRQQPGLQVLELACGLSARGIRTLRRYHREELTYIEADLPDVVQHKQDLLAEMEFSDPRHRLVPCNILRDQGPLSPEGLLAGLDPERPVLVISEGLVNYFALETMKAFWHRLALALSRFPEGAYIADVWPRLPRSRGLRARDWVIRGIEAVTRQEVPLHFDNDEAIKAGFQACGFARVDLLDPANPPQGLVLPTLRTPSLFRVVSARVQAS